MSYLRRVDALLDEIARSDRLRTIAPDDPALRVNFSNNDYLALATDSRVLAAMRRCERVGSSGSRLLGGRRREHWELEETLAHYVGRERALVFSSGYLAAAGAIGVLARLVDVVYSDALNHACIIDALRAGRVDRVIYPHAALPARALRRAPALIVSETIFSMDGDAIDLAPMVGELGEDDILLVDEAHALGVCGPRGGGLARLHLDPRIVVMGTLSKAIGCAGGFIAGPTRLIELMVTSARPFIFDTALAPPIAAAARAALDISLREDERRARLHENVARLRGGLRAQGVPTGSDPSPIVPLILGDERRALALAAYLRSIGIEAPAIRPPTVPPGTSRLRLSVRSDHSEHDVDSLLEGVLCTAIS